MDGENYPPPLDKPWLTRLELDSWIERQGYSENDLATFQEAARDGGLPFTESRLVQACELTKTFPTRDEAEKSAWADLQGPDNHLLPPGKFGFEVTLENLYSFWRPEGFVYLDWQGKQRANTIHSKLMDKLGTPVVTVSPVAHEDYNATTHGPWTGTTHREGAREIRQITEQRITRHALALFFREHPWLIPPGRESYFQRAAETPSQAEAPSHGRITTPEQARAMAARRHDKLRARKDALKAWARPLVQRGRLNHGEIAAEAEREGETEALSHAQTLAAIKALCLEMGKPELIRGTKKTPPPAED